MASLIDFLLVLLRDPEQGQAFVANPEQTLRDAGLSDTTADQIAAVAEIAVPNLALVQGDPVAGLQRAVAAQHNIPTAFGPRTDPMSRPDLVGAAESTNILDDLQWVYRVPLPVVWMTSNHR